MLNLKNEINELLEEKRNINDKLNEKLLEYYLAIFRPSDYFKYKTTIEYFLKNQYAFWSDTDYLNTESLPIKDIDINFTLKDTDYGNTVSIKDFLFESDHSVINITPQGLEFFRKIKETIK